MPGEAGALGTAAAGAEDARTWAKEEVEVVMDSAVSLPVYAGDGACLAPGPDHRSGVRNGGEEVGVAQDK